LLNLQAGLADTIHLIFEKTGVTAKFGSFYSLGECGPLKNNSKFMLSSRTILPLTNEWLRILQVIDFYLKELIIAFQVILVMKKISLKLTETQK